jgi:hypothetical protein
LKGKRGDHTAPHVLVLNLFFPFLQSKAAGAKSEREMVEKLEANETLLKFGHAFLTPGMGNMASRWILRNNDKGTDRTCVCMYLSVSTVT